MWCKICIYQNFFVPLQRQIKITPKQHEPHRLRGELYAAGCAAGLATFGVSPAAFCINAKPNKTMNTQTTPAPAFSVSATTAKLMQAYKAAAECHNLLFEFYLQQVGADTPELEKAAESYAEKRCKMIGTEGVKEAVFAEIEGEVFAALNLNDTEI